MMALCIRLFGSLELVLNRRSQEASANEQVVLCLSSPQARSLLAYLILHHDQPIPRARLTGIFWPDRPDARARRALSHALWQIRDALGPTSPQLMTEEDTVCFTLRPDDWLDVAIFQDKAREGDAPSSRVADLNEAVGIYRADFLEACYDDWALVERERLRERYLWVLGQLITLYKQKADYGRALECAHRLAAADPLREAAHRELMQLYHLLGRPRAALAQYETLCQFLDEELGVEPAAATTALYHEIITVLEEAETPHLPVAAPPPPLLRDLTHLPFVGRVEERATLLARLQSAGHGHGGMALVEGDAGVGKSRLVEEIIADAKWRGFQVGLSKASPLAEPPPYQLLHDALSPLLTPLRVAQLAELVEPLWLSAVAPILPRIAQQLPDLPSLPSLDPREEQRRLWEGLARCIAGLASVAPLLLILEDLHWADEAILAALPHLAPRLPTSRALLVLTYRPAEARQRDVVWETLEALDRALPLLRVSLSPFEPSEAANLVRRALGVGETDAQIGAFARRLQDETDGNALFLVETLKALLEQGDLAPVVELPSAGWRLPAEDLPLPIPASVQELIGERVTHLSAGLRDVLEWVAVLGENADFPVLARASDAESAALLAALDELGRRGFLLETPGRYRFEHDLVQDVVYHATTPARRLALHRRAGDALEALHPEQIEALARHFYRSGERSKALIYTLQAGERAEAVYDYQSALTHYRRAATLTDTESDRWDALARQEMVLGVLSRREEQARILGEMLRLAEVLDDPLRRARTLYRQGWREVLSGKPAQALTFLEEAATLARSTGEQNLLGTCLVATARAWWRIGETAPCQAAVEEAYALFQETGHRQGQSETLNMLGNLHLGLTGNYVQALKYFEELRVLSGERGNQYREAAAQGNIGITCTLLGAYERSQEALTASLQIMEQVGDRHWRGIIHHWQGANHLGWGNLIRAQEMAERALQICREVGNRNFEIASLELQGLIALARRAPEQAHRHFQEASEVAQAHGQTMDWALNQSHLALALLHLGRLEEARLLSDQAVARLEGLEGHVSHSKEVYFERCQIVAAMEGPEAARPDLERAHRHLQKMAAQIEDPALRRSFLENPRNRAIVIAHRLGRIPSPLRQQSVSLPRADVPTGRPLRDDEYVEITWTVAAPEDDEIASPVERRRHRILRLLREATEQSAAPTVQHLADALDVSTRTIKRDLAALRAAGHDVRTRGSRD